MAKRNTSSFLPQAYQTERNKKFLSATLDQLMSSSNLTRMDGFVGRKYAPSFKVKDNYLTTTGLRRNYHLEPAIVTKKDSTIDSIVDSNDVGSVVTYDDLLNKLKDEGVDITDHSKLFGQEFYNWAGFINFDTLVNYGSYYWLKDGPNSVSITGGDIKMSGEWNIKYNDELNRYNVTELEGINPTIYLARGGVYTFETDQLENFWIQTDPGSITGTQAETSTKSSREIYGVTNNGGAQGDLEPAGGITFTVPDVTAQSFYENNLNLLADVNLFSEVPYKDVQGRRLADLIDQHNGIDNQRMLVGKTVVFKQNEDHNVDNDNWTFKADYSKHPFDRLGFAQEDGMVKQEERVGVWKINEVDGILVLNKINTVTYDDRAKITEGTTYGGRQIYRAQETEFVTIIPVLTAHLDTLYYQHGSDRTSYGIIKLVDAEAKEIKTTDFLGKSQYTSPNGIVFTNGLKITFDSTIDMPAYVGKTYYVQGVGSKIYLVDTELTTPELGTDTKDYITLTRGSVNKNAWSRSNRWFHKDIITATASYNKTTAIFDEKNRAVRPIIEFEAGLDLYNSGSKGHDGVDLADTVETDALSNINGVSGYFVDRVSLSAGTKVIFIKDKDSQTRKTIWEVGYEDTDGDSSAESLVLKDSGIIVNTNDSVYINKGTAGKGTTYHWDGTNWIASQTKTKINQYPLFNLFDSKGISFNNTTTYPSSDFLGNQLFKFSVGSGSNDTELGFPLKYRTFNNVGDILFENVYTEKKFNYKKSTGITSLSTATGLVKVTDPYDSAITYNNGWQKSLHNSRQYQQVEYIVSDITLKNFDIGVKVKTSTNAVPNIFVYINNKRTSNFTTSVLEGVNICTINDTIAIDDSIIIRLISDATSKHGYYTIPKNLEDNSYNDKFSTITLGQLQNHVSALIDTNKYFTGKLQGSNNLRDLENSKSTEGLILQHSSSMILPMLLNQPGDLNFTQALRFCGLEYEKFKSKFLTALETLDNLELTDAQKTVDAIMVYLNSNKKTTFPFYTSDMVPYGADATTTTYTITDNRDKTYEITSVHDNSIPSNRAVLVYLNDVQLYHNIDYTFETTSANIRIIKTLTIGDVLKFIDYTDTLGNYVPPTPTKLGLWKKYKPEIVNDTTYSVDQNIIVGHDGSRTIAYGDTRDNILLELEKRIYNNCKTAYDEDVFNLDEYTPGRFKTTDFAVKEVDAVLEDEFLRWSTRHRIPYTENTTFNANDSFTWNYTNFVDKLEGTLLPQGYWKGLYKHYYDTVAPHIRAWEMFGWSIKPSWWEDRYGVGPYTSGNKVLWDDVRDGRRYTSADVDDYTINLLYARPSIELIMPVDEHGVLKPPIDCITKNSEDLSPSHAWKFGDVAPPEYAWRNSSSFAFSVNHLMALIKPSEYFSQVFNKSQIVRNKLTKQLVMTTTNQRQQPKDLKVDLPTARYEGCCNFVSEYLRWQNIDVTKHLQNVLSTLDIRLAHKMEGYTDHNLIKVLAEQVSPTSTSNSVYVPDEDYNIHLHKTGPLRSIPYSGVIVQVGTSGYTIYGYNLNNPKFSICNPIMNGNYKVHDVDGETIYEYDEYESEIKEVPYGHTFRTKQEVADFFFSYQKYLTRNGYDFDNRMEDFGTQKIVANWLMSVKEFIHWSKQGWLSGSVIAISPSANRIRCVTPAGVAEALSNSQAQTNVLNQNYEPLRPSSYKISRQDNEFELYPNPDMGGIYFVNTKLVEYEHVLVFNNVTKFNDVIYQPSLGNRQYRLRLVGYKTGGWNGSLTAEGFIYNDGKVPVWVANTDYVRGDIIKFKDNLYTAMVNHTSSEEFIYENWSLTDSFKIGLLPNFDTLGKNFESFYDVNTVNLESETDKYGKGSIGYQNREYFNQIGLDDISQVKFYQGMLQEKGTRSAVDKLIRSNFDQFSSDISFYEEWAIRQAEYGASDVNSRIEIQLDEEGFKDNPQEIKVVPTTQSKSDLNSKTEFTPSQLYKAPSDLTYDWVPLRKSFKAGVDSKAFYDELLPTAGYPKLTDADATLFYSVDANTLTPMIANMKVGYTVWVADDGDNDWDMKYLDTTTTQVINCDGGQDGSTYTWTTKDTHYFKKEDIVVIKDYSTKRDGVYRITEVPSVTSFKTAGGGEVAKEEATALVLKFISSRFKTSSTIERPRQGWDLKDKLYIDEDENNHWYVLKKNTSYTANQSINPLLPQLDENFGDAICSDPTGQWVLIGQKNLNKFHVYTPQPIELKQFAAITSTASNVDELGASVSTGAFLPREGGALKYEKWHRGKIWVAIGAPNTNSGKGAIMFYYRDLSSGSFLPGTLDQPTTLGSNAKFGTNVKMSANGEWCVVSAPGDKKVFIYHLAHGNDNDETATQSFIGDGSTTQWTLDTNFDDASVTEELYIRIEGNDLIAGRDYTYNLGTRTITFTTAPSTDHSISVTFLRGWSLVDERSSTIEGYGSSIDIDSQGNYIVIGDPNRDTVAPDSTTNMGSIDILARHYEVFIGDGSTKEFTVSTADIGRASSPVYINGVETPRITNSTITWTKAGNTITFVTAPQPGEDITIWTDNFTPLQTLTPSDPQVNGQFALTSVRIDETAQSIYVGVPEKDGMTENSGIVEVFDRQDSIVENKCTLKAWPIGSYTTGHSMFINGYKITATGTTLQNIVDDINNKNIPGITASGSNNNLTIQSSKNVKGFIHVTVGASGTLMKDLNLHPFTSNTGKIIKLKDGKTGHRFGQVLEVTRDNKQLIVGCPNGSTTVKTNFDDGTTLFDGGGSRFLAEKYFTGSVHVYQKINAGHIEADSLYASGLDANDGFGSALAITEHNIYVGSPFDDTSTVSNSGRVVHFTKTDDLYKVDEKEQDLVDVERINKAFLYNTQSNTIMSYLDYIDPVKGKVLGEAEHNIDYKTTWDPAIYNYTDGTKKINNGDNHWQSDKVGKIWWDLSKVKFINYEQGDNDYKKLFWGGVFPGSDISIYQWVESSVKPESYTAGNAKYGNSVYVEIQSINNVTKQLQTKYYFWASAILTVHSTKTSSVAQIRQMIVDPITNGTPYIMFLGKDSIGLTNVSGYLEDKNVVVAIDYDKKPNDKLLHTEWSLVEEGNPKSFIPEELFEKIKDSLAGADSRGNKVPDISLSAGDKYGIKIRPRQSVFMNRYLAMQEYITYVNAVIKKYNIADTIDFTLLNSEEKIPSINSGTWDETVDTMIELGYIKPALHSTGYNILVKTDSDIGGRWSIHTLQADKTWLRSRSQSYDTKLFWAYCDWYSTGYSSDTTIDYRYELFNDIYKNTIADKSIIKINNGGNWDLYIKDGNDYTLIGQKDGTIQFGTDLYDYVTSNLGFDSEGYDFNLMDTEPQIETRNIVETIKKQLLVGDLANEHNKLMFVLLRFALQEQPFVDWIFKTSFVSVKHNLRALDQFPTYQRDNQEFVKNYINEVKPYHTKIREYVLGYNKLETHEGDTTDFDIPSGYDSITKTFRSPNGENSHDAGALTTDYAYKMWNENHSYQVDSLSISKWGYGYATAPTITIEAPKDKNGTLIPGGVAATAKCTIVDNHIDVVTMIKKGSGYIKAPVVTLTGGSPMLNGILHANLKNTEIRKIKETIKFDRTRYSSSVKEWTANTTYSTSDIIQHLGEAYTVNEAFTSSTAFDSDKLTIKADATFNNAMDRTMAYYIPKTGQDGKDLGQIFKGITYPGTKVQGPLFTKDPGLDKGGFDTREFDNYEIDKDGRFVISADNIDLDLQGKFNDTQLGLRPEDIIVDGSSKFVDAYSSHAPEEFVPGRVFDSLNINVFTSPSRDSDGDGALGPAVSVINYKGDGSNKVFKFGTNKQTDQKVIVWSKTSGRISSSAYTIDWNDNVVKFTTAPLKDEIISVTSFGTTGDKLLFDYEFQASGGETVVTLPIPYSLIENKQTLVLANGSHSTGGTFVDKGSDTDWDPAVSWLTKDDHIHFFVFDVPSSSTRTFSKVTVDEFTVNDSTRTFTLTDGADDDLARTDKVIVELNGKRLRPPVFTYLTNDSSSATYDLTTSSDIDHSTLVKANTRVYINGVQTTNYSIVEGSDSTIKAIQLDEAPAANSKIDVGVTTNADYILTDSTTLTITGGTWTGSDKVVVTTFNNHNNMKMTTETFKGGSSSAITTDIGFDIRGFESVSFDAVTASVVNIAEFNLFKTPTNLSYLWVTKNGVKMIPNFDYKIVGGKLAFAESLQASDITIITQFTEEIIKPAVGFKIFKDLHDKVHYHRLANENTAELSTELLAIHSEIKVTDASRLPTPDLNKAIPGVIWINNERIEYLEINLTTNTLSRIKRGTLGTGCQSTHTAGSLVVDTSSRQEIPSAHTKTWYQVSGGNPSDGNGLQNSTTIQADFLVKKPTYIKS